MSTPAGATGHQTRGALPVTLSVYASEARTATPASTGPNGEQGFGVPRGATHLTLNINTTAEGTSPTTVFTIEAWDPAKDGFVTLLASSAITTVSEVRLHVGHDAPITANLSINTSLPSQMRVVATHGNGTSHTYSVSAFFS